MNVVGGVARHKCLRRIRNMFAAFYLQTQTHRRTKQTSFVWPNTINRSIKNKNHPKGWFVFLVGAGGVEPPQSKTTDLQSAPALRLRRAPRTLLVRAEEIRTYKNTMSCVVSNELMFAS